MARPFSNHTGDSMQENNQVRIITTRVSPHELLLLFSMVLLGVTYLFVVPAPPSIAATQPHWLVVMWAAVMLLSGGSGMVACLVTRILIDTRLRVERGAMMLGASAMMIYTMSLFVYAGWRALGSGITFALWASANLWRAVQIQKEIKEIR